MLGLVLAEGQQIQELILHTVAGASGLASDHLDHGVQAAAGGLQGVASHLGPLLLDRRQKLLKVLPEERRDWGNGLALRRLLSLRLDRLLPWLLRHGLLGNTVAGRA